MQNLLSIFALTTAISMPLSISDPEPIQIVFHEVSESIETRSLVPIVGWIDTNMGFIHLYFYDSLGDVDVYLEHLTSNDSYQMTVEGDGSVSIPFVASEGTWRVILTLGSGKEYIGTFII